MKDDKKGKEEMDMNMNAGYMSQMPPMPPMPQMQQMPYMGQMPPMPQNPMMCCPLLMNMQCPLMYNQGVGGMTNSMPPYPYPMNPYMYNPMMGMQY